MKLKKKKRFGRYLSDIPPERRRFDRCPDDPRLHILSDEEVGQMLVAKLKQDQEAIRRDMELYRLQKELEKNG